MGRRVTYTKDTDASAELSSDALLTAVKAFLMDCAAPNLEGRHRFNARVAANVLGIIQREHTIGPTLKALDEDALRRWLPESGPNEPAQQLSRALADGRITPDDRFFDYLKARQLLVSAINNPRYASRAIAEERWDV